MNWLSRDLPALLILALFGGVNTLAGLVIGFYFGKSASEDRATP